MSTTMHFKTAPPPSPSIHKVVDCTVPDHGTTIWAEAESGDGAVVALQHTHTLTGAQVPQSNATVQGGGEELQPADVWVELDKAAMMVFITESVSFS